MALFGKILVLMLPALKDVGKHASQIFVFGRDDAFLSFVLFKLLFSSACPPHVQ